MKKLIFIVVSLLVMNVGSCFSQFPENYQKEFESRTRAVYGYSDDFNELTMAITFGKKINAVNTAYYIKFQLYAPNSELRQDIQIKKTSVLTFLSKSGKTVDLPLTDVISSTANKQETDNPFSVKSDYSTILMVNVTKEQLIEIGSEPFYHLILPYYNTTWQLEKKAFFTSPTLFIRKTFTQKYIKYILDVF